MVLNDENPWDRVLVSTMFALHATVYTTMQHTPVQSVFRQDSILNTRHAAKKRIIKKCNHDLMKKGNKQENCNKKEHTYKKRDKILLKNTWKQSSTRCISGSLCNHRGGGTKVKLQTHSTFAILFNTKSKCASILGQHNMDKYSQL